MNYRTRSILFTSLTCICLASVFLFIFFFFKERNTPIDENSEDDQTEISESAREAREKRFREHRQRERARNNRVINVVQQNENDMNNPQHVREEFRKGLEEYRALPPEERAYWNEEMSKLSYRILNDGVPQVIDGIRNASPEELADMREQFTHVTEFLDTTIHDANLASMLTPEEDLTIGQFLRDINSAHDEVQRALYTN